MIETERLSIRKFLAADVEEFFGILAEPVTMQFWAKPYELDGARAWIDRSLQSYAEQGIGRYVIVLRDEQRIIGDCGILRMNLAGEEVYDFGYIIHHPFWRKGYAEEAAIAVRDYAFEHLKLPMLHANMPWNHYGSIRVAEKLGMRKIREFINQRNRDIRTMLYAIAAPEQP
jgi:[ribosomal protein S5]-alanine N-acetyltransferase